MTNYPLGAEFDENAPFNEQEQENECMFCGSESENKFCNLECEKAFFND